MRRCTAALLMISLLLSGCGFLNNRIMEPVTFYYVDSEYDYGRNPSVIVSEEREASGHKNDLSYLLALYLMGPAQEEHKMPLPPGTRIIKPEQRGDTVFLELSNSAYSLSDADLTLACACLTMTCLDITDAQKVSITYQQRTVTMDHTSFTMTDNTGMMPTTEENQ